MRYIILLLFFVGTLYPQLPTNDECAEDNENVACCFINAPKQLSQVISIAGTEEQGERLSISGAMKKRDGRMPFPGVVLYAYHTNRSGIYPKKGSETGIHKWHGYLHAWGKTNEKGEFEIRTIRPAQYPSNTTPAHIHIVAKEPGGTVYYVNDIMFADDPLLRGKKEDGVIDVRKNADGVWTGSAVIRQRK